MAQLSHQSSGDATDVAGISEAGWVVGENGGRVVSVTSDDASFKKSTLGPWMIT